MANLSDFLSPEELESLKQAANNAPFKSARDSAEVFSGMPRTAAESAETLANAPEIPTDYSKLFNKQVAQDVVDSASVPGKTAADSASVFSKALPEGIEEGKGLISSKMLPAVVDSAVEAAASTGSSLLPGLAKIASKANIPLSVLTGLLDSTDVRADEKDNPEIAQRLADLEKSTYFTHKDNNPNESDLPPSSDDSSSGDSSDQTSPELLQAKSNLDNSIPNPNASNPKETYRSLIDRTNGLTPVQSRMNSSDMMAALLGAKQGMLSGAQDSRNNMNLISLLGQAGANLGQAFTPLAKLNTGNDIYKKIGDMGDQGVQDVINQSTLENQTTKGLMDQRKLQDEMEASNPNSTKSQFYRQYLKDNLKINAPDNMSASDLEKALPVITKHIDMQENAKMRSAMAKQSNDHKEELADIAINKTMANLTPKMNNDPILKPSEQNLTSINKAGMILNNASVPLTPQLLDDAQQDMASALQIRGQMGATEGKVDRTLIHDYETGLAKLKQYMTDYKDVDLRQQDPGLVKTVLGMQNSLSSDYKKTIKERRNYLLDQESAALGDSPKYDKKLKKIRDVMNDDKFLQDDSISQSTKMMAPDGSVRLVPNDQVQNAIAAGGKVAQ